MSRHYKVLTKDLKSPFQDFQFELGKQYDCDDFDSSEIECSRGFYATPTVEGLLYCNLANDSRAFECEVSGKSKKFDSFKHRHEKITIVREIPRAEVISLAKKLEPRLGYKLSEAFYPIDPFKIKSPPNITKDHIGLVKNWDSVKDSVRASVWESVIDSVWDSVWDSVRDSVWASVWDSVMISAKDSARDSVWNSVWGSVWDSVWAYTSSLFPKIKKWRHIDHEKGENPFQPAIDLWYMGLMPSFDGRIWRLHSGPQGEILWKGNLITNGVGEDKIQKPED